MRKETKIFLDREELAWVAAIVADAAAGLYTVRQLFGEQWQFVRRKRAFGRWFKKSVLACFVRSVEWRGRNPSKSQIYELVK